MSKKPQAGLDAAGTICLLLLSSLLGAPYLTVLAQEPSPIDIELVAPAQAAPGKLFQVIIKFDATDIKAGADINYNVFGPARIWSRDPEPPNPLVNTWKPTWDNVQGTITIQLLVDDDADGETVRHEIEVRWGDKHKNFQATTQIKYIPPTATPTSTPRPARPVPTSTPQPASTATALPARVNLTGASFVNADGAAIENAQVNDDIGLVINYTSSQDLEDVTLIVRFTPDIVNLDDAQYADGAYTVLLSNLPAAPDGASKTLPGHIRVYADGGAQYELYATVQHQAGDGATLVELDTAPIVVEQPTLLQVGAVVETDVVKSGGSIIVHARCENPGAIPARWLTLKLDGLAEGFTVSPLEQTVDVVAADGGVQERLFTIHAPDDYEGIFTFKVVAEFDQTTVESAPATIELAPPARLTLDVVAGQNAVRAGDVFYVNVTCANDGRFMAEQVSVKLIDTTGNLGVLFQDLGDIPVGESRQAVFVVEIPADFAENAQISLAAQAVAADGTLSQSTTVSVDVACVPMIEISVQPPSGQVQSGQSVQVIVSASNASQCTARNLTVLLSDLPAAFSAPEAQTIAELGPGATRHLNFALQLPPKFRDDVPFRARILDEQSSLLDDAQGVIAVGGVSPVFTAIFVGLVLLAIAAIVVGLLLYFKNK